ncbi:MAG: GNAT family N-acetyltransferase [Rhodospirillales bacterium]
MLQSEGPVYTTEAVAEVFAGLADDWERLALRRETPVVRHAWLAAVMACQHLDADWCLILIPDQGRLAAGALLHSRRIYGIKTWAVLADDTPGAMVWRDGPALARLIAALLDWKKPLAIRGFDSGGVLRDLLGRQPKPPGLRLFRPGRMVHSLTLGGSWETFLSRLPARRRKQLRRKKAKAESLGCLTFEALRPNVTDAEELFSRFCRLEDKGWKASQAVSIQQSPDYRRFWESIALAASAENRLRFFELRIGNRLAAGHFAIVEANRLWGLKIAYDPDFSACSPGLLLDEAVLRHALETGLRTYEFMGDAEPWEAFWEPALRRYELLRFYPATLKGLLVLAADSLAHVRKAMDLWRKTISLRRAEAHHASGGPDDGAERSGTKTGPVAGQPTRTPT